jgi:hypothetical protein
MLYLIWVNKYINSLTKNKFFTLPLIKLLYPVPTMADQ